MLQNSNAIEDGGYVIARSLRFNSASSTHVSRVPSVAGNRRTWTYSTVIKRGALGTIRPLLSGYSDLANKDYNSATFMFDTDDTLRLSILGVTGAAVIAVRTLAKFRDPSAHYHVVLAMDTTQATNTNGVRIYVNGVLQALTFTAYTQNQESNINNTTVQYIGAHAVNTIFGGGNAYSDGYMSEIRFINGQSLDASSFGEINQTTGQWVVKKYTGTYGTNGFYLDFKDGTSTTTLGYDKSGNNNHWTLTNFTRSAGVNDCWMLDVPAGNGSASAVQPSGNYAVLNPLHSSGVTLSKGNLTVSQTATAQGYRSSFAMTTGKWVWWVIPTVAGIHDTIGIVREGTPLTTDLVIGGSNAVVYYAFTGNKYINGTVSAYGATYTTNDVIRVEVDIDNNTVEFFKNNTSQGLITGLSLSGNTWYASAGNANNQSVTKAFNFGQHYIAETPTAGFKALCTANLPTSSIKKPSDHFNIQLSTGANIKTDAEALFTNELEWIKDRANANNHQLIDSVRGSNAVLQSNTTVAETTYTAPSGSSVGWVWRASDSAAVTNSVGSISSQVSANPTAGFSIVTYTQTASAGTIGHGLGVPPSVIIVKNRDVAGSNWPVQHASLGPTQLIILSSTNASTASAVWNNTAPTSSVFSVGTGPGGDVNGFAGRTQVAYCFAEIAGYSKFGSYTGNGSADGPFVHTGFKPRFVMIKRTDAAASWVIMDTSRDTYNIMQNNLLPNTTDAEAAFAWVDFTSTGFKVRTSNAAYNASGGTYIYMAFAETPFQYSNAR